MVLSRPKDYRMPFSKERTQQIKARLEECLDDDTLNQWERELLAKQSKYVPAWMHPIVQQIVSHT